MLENSWESPVSERIVTPLQSTMESEMRLAMRVYHFLVDLRLRSRPFFLQKPSKKWVISSKQIYQMTQPTHCCIVNHFQMMCDTCIWMQQKPLFFLKSSCRHHGQDVALACGCMCWVRLGLGGWASWRDISSRFIPSHFDQHLSTAWRQIWLSHKMLINPWTKVDVATLMYWCIPRSEFLRAALPPHPTLP